MDSRPLELDGHQTQQLLAQVAERIRVFLEGLETAPATTTGSQGPFDAPPGENPRAVDELLDLAFSAAGIAVETAGPRFFGYIPGGGVVSSAVGELISRIVNRYTGLADLAPGLVALEDGLLRWLASLFDLPTGAGGLLTTGGSQAMLSMVLAARQRSFDDDEDDPGQEPDQLVARVDARGVRRMRCLRREATVPGMRNGGDRQGDADEQSEDEELSPH